MYDEFEYYRRWLEVIESAYESALEDIADEIREKMIKPICKKYNLTFISGMGICYFSTKGGRIFEENRLPSFLKPIYKVLQLQTSQGHDIGEYISDVPFDH